MVKRLMTIFASIWSHFPESFPSKKVEKKSAEASFPGNGILGVKVKAKKDFSRSKEDNDDKVSKEKRDQIWRNFTTLAKKSLSIDQKLFKYLPK